MKYYLIYFQRVLSCAMATTTESKLKYALHHVPYSLRPLSFSRIHFVLQTPQYVALSLMNVYDSKNFNYKHMTKILITHEGPTCT